MLRFQKPENPASNRAKRACERQRGSTAPEAEVPPPEAEVTSVKSTKPPSARASISALDKAPGDQSSHQRGSPRIRNGRLFKKRCARSATASVSEEVTSPEAAVLPPEAEVEFCPKFNLFFPILSDASKFTQILL